MTQKDSICVSCSNLECGSDAVCRTNGKTSLISECHYGGKNSGNRKTCKRYSQASGDVIIRRMNILNKYGRADNER